MTDLGRYPLNARVPDPDGPDPHQQHWHWIRQHELRVQACAACRHSRTPATEVCPRCQGTDSFWEPVPAHGTVYTWSRVWHPANEAVADRVPYLLVWVEVDHPDRPRFLGNLLGDPLQPIEVDDPVVGVFQDGPGGTVLNWQTSGAR